MVDPWSSSPGALPAALLALAADGLLALAGRAPTRAADRQRCGAVAAGRWSSAGSAGFCDRRRLAGAGDRRRIEELHRAGASSARSLAQTIERQTGLSVERRLNLGGTLVCDEALRRGDIDVYVEYTGTALTALFNEPVGPRRRWWPRACASCYAAARRDDVARPRLQQHLRHPGARRGRPRAEARAHQRPGARRPALARRVRLRVPRAAGRLCRASPRLRPALSRARRASWTST